MTTAPNDHALAASIRRTLDIEAGAVAQLASRPTEACCAALRLMLACQGRVVVTGVGKSGHIGRKIAATLASTGTPAFFMHAAEASHGDLGMVTSSDVLMAISYSGSSEELLAVLPVVKRLGIPLIGISGRPGSELARLSDVHLDVSVEQEACPLNLAPTASTTATLALGDALAVALLEARGFGPDDFARSHPGGALGRRLLLRVRDVMRQGEQLPRVNETATVTEALAEMSRKGMGMTLVFDAKQQISGIFTDGDLRRLIERRGDVRSLSVAEGMTRHPVSVQADELAATAAAALDARRISQMIVFDGDTLCGALHLHDLMRAKVI
jgi:arabinose-5-phosphate isomerase